jgi:hypothetical protein
VSRDVTEDLSTRALQAAARKLDQRKHDLIPQLGAARRRVTSDVEARDTAERRLAADEQAYTDLRQTALKNGWTAAQLAKLGLGPIKNAPHKQRRRHGSTTAVPAAGHDAQVERPGLWGRHLFRPP